MSGPDPSIPDPERGKQEIDPRTLSEVGSLALRARTIADSALSGMHRSRHHGSSVEFAEHKEYAPGDDVRHLDWRAFGRFDRDYVKRFEDESSLRALMVVDNSASMAYPGPDAGRPSKLDYAKEVAGALAYVLARQGDAVGVASYAQDLEVRVPARARRGHLQEVLSELDSLRPSGRTRLDAALDKLSEGLSRRTIVVVFSDLFDGALQALSGFGRLSARRHDVVLFHVLDSDELQFPFEDATEFVGMENDARVRIDARAIREAYLDELARFLREAEQASRGARVEYLRARTDQPAGRLLRGFLASRLRLRSVRR